MQTPFCDVDSKHDGLTAPRAYQCSLVCSTTRQWLSAFSGHVHKSATTHADDLVSTWLQGIYTDLLLMLSEMAEALDSIATPESEKKCRCLNCALLKNSCTQGKTPHISFSWKASQSKLILNFSPDVTGEQIGKTVNWKTRNKIAMICP